MRRPTLDAVHPNLWAAIEASHPLYAQQDSEAWRPANIPYHIRRADSVEGVTIRHSAPCEHLVRTAGGAVMAS